jgi:sarcosine oxidase, subunit gamma
MRRGDGHRGLPRVLCTGPGEWLVVHAPTAVERLCEVLAPALENRSLVLVDLTEGLVALEISGSEARAVLGKSCGLDFDPRRFRHNQCARTRFANIAVLIDCIQPGQVYILYVGRSHASYLKSWLADAATGCEAETTSDEFALDPLLPRPLKY